MQSDDMDEDEVLLPPIKFGGLVPSLSADGPSRQPEVRRRFHHSIGSFGKLTWRMLRYGHRGSIRGQQLSHPFMSSISICPSHCVERQPSVHPLIKPIFSLLCRKIRYHPVIALIEVVSPTNPVHTPLSSTCKIHMTSRSIVIMFPLINQPIFIHTVISKAAITEVLLHPAR